MRASDRGHGQGPSPTSSEGAKESGARPAQADPQHAVRRAGPGRRSPASCCCATSARCPATQLPPHACGPRASCSSTSTTPEPLRPEDVAVGSLTFAKPEGLDESTTRTSRRDRQGRPDDRPAASRRTSRTSASGLVATRASSPSRRSAPTSAARSACTSSRRTTCSARATSRPSTSPTAPGSSSARPVTPCRSCAISVNDEGYLEAHGDFDEPVGPSFWERG